LAVLGSGFVAAALLAWSIRRVRRREGAVRPGLARRLLSLTGRMVVDLLPVLVFAAVAYAVLALVEVRHEARLVAIALINASIISRLMQALSAFLLAPDAPPLRLWRIGDETAQYVHHWVKRLTFIGIYGFFVLQAALLLGLDGGAYRVLLNLLGAVMLGLLLVLIAQNREDVAQAIAAAPPADTDEPPQMLPLRRGFARTWHLVAGLYLLLVYAIWVMQVEGGAQFVLRATLISLAVLASTLLLFRASDRLFDRGLRLSDELQHGFPGLEKRLNRYFPVLRKMLKAVVVAFAALLIADAWGVDALHWLIEGSGRVLLRALLNILLILTVAVVLWELASGAVERYLGDGTPGVQAADRSPRIRTLLTVGRNALLIVLTLVATLMVLSELGINIAPLLAGAGVVGLAIGFGAQRLVQDVINGVFILFQDLMAVGDVVKLGDKGGVVEALSIRTVRLRDLAGVVHTIPFSSIEGVSNLTREFSFHVFEIGIAYREDVDGVVGLLKQIGEELRADVEIGPLILEPLEVFGLDAFGDSAIVIKGRIKTRPIKQWQVGRAFNRLVKIRFDEHGIEIPFPHRTLYFGQDKDGTAPPAFVELESMMQKAAGSSGE
jgi:small conductance mechanosensitive channel